jgi:hypothetical protein
MLEGRHYQIGHYLEYAWMPDEMWIATGGR